MGAVLTGISTCGCPRRGTAGYSFVLVVAIVMMKPETRKNRKNNIRRWTEKCLLLAGVVGLGLWCASIVVPAVWQGWGNWVFDHELRGETATVEGYVTAKADEITRDMERRLGLTPRAKA